MGLTKCLIICCLPPPGCFARCKAWAPPPRGWPRCRGAGEPTSEAPQSPPPEAAPPWGFPNPWSTLHHSAVAGFPHPLWEESGFPWHPTGHLGPRPLSFQPNSMMLQKKPHLSKQLSKLGQNAENCKYDQTGVGHIKNHQRATPGLRLQGFKGPLDGRGLKSLLAKTIQFLAWSQISMNQMFWYFAKIIYLLLFFLITICYLPLYLSRSWRWAKSQIIDNFDTNCPSCFLHCLKTPKDLSVNSDL